MATEHSCHHRCRACSLLGIRFCYRANIHVLCDLHAPLVQVGQHNMCISEDHGQVARFLLGLRSRSRSRFRSRSRSRFRSKPRSRFRFRSNGLCHDLQRFNCLDYTLLVAVSLPGSPGSTRNFVDVLCMCARKRARRA